MPDSSRPVHSHQSPTRLPTKPALRADSRWTSAALLAFVVLAIVALALVPVAVDRYTRPLNDEMRSITEPGRGLVTEIQLALALEGSILHDFFDTGDTVLIGRYRQARQREVTANERLARLTGRLGPTVQERYDVLRQLERQWHGRVEPFITWNTVSASRSDPLHAQLYEDVLVAAAQLDDALEIATRNRRQRILGAERLQRRTTVVLGITALAALAAVIWLGVRLQDYAAATEQARLSLEQALESKARLMRGISHDLKNPLSAIEGHAALLEEGIVGELGERQRHSVRRIRSGVRSLLVLIGDLLELSRAEVGELRITSQPVDVREVVREAVDEYQAEARVARHTISITALNELPLVETDANRVRQILGNLLSNAIKYTPPGGCIEVRAELRRMDGASGSPQRLAIDVSDSGPGIPPDKLGLLFDEFARFDDTGKPGTGLGLAIARRVAQLLNGDITVTSDVGRGSCFTLWLRTS
jgi:signal transduction histidine kinase